MLIKKTPKKLYQKKKYVNIVNWVISTRGIIMCRRIHPESRWANLPTPWFKMCSGNGEGKTLVDSFDISTASEKLQPMLQALGQLNTKNSEANPKGKHVKKVLSTLYKNDDEVGKAMRESWGRHGARQWGRHEEGMVQGNEGGMVQLGGSMLLTGNPVPCRQGTAVESCCLCKQNGRRQSPHHRF